MTTTSTAAATCPCMLEAAGGTILPSTCQRAAHRYMAGVSAYNAEAVEKLLECKPTASASRRRYWADRAAAMRRNEADSLRWAAEATCKAA